MIHKTKCQVRNTTFGDSLRPLVCDVTSWIILDCELLRPNNSGAKSLRLFGTLRGSSLCACQLTVTTRTLFGAASQYHLCKPASASWTLTCPTGLEIGCAHTTRNKLDLNAASAANSRWEQVALKSCNASNSWLNEVDNDIADP